MGQSSQRVKQDDSYTQAMRQTPICVFVAEEINPHMHNFLVCLVCHPTKTNKSCISRESDRQAGEAGKQADRKWKREWQAINGNKGGTIALSNGCLHQNSRLPLNFTLDFPLKINSTFISEKILYVELNEECFKDKMNQPLTLLCLPSPVFETVNRISWLGVLEV